MRILNKYMREMLRLNRRRTIVTIIGIILSMTLFTAIIEGGFSGREYLRKCIETGDGPYNGVVKSIDCETAKKIMNDDAIKDTAFVQDIGWALINKDSLWTPYLRVVSVSDDYDKLMKIRMKKGRLPEKDDEIVLPENFQFSEGNYEIGQEITLDLGERYFENRTLHSTEEYMKKGKKEEALQVHGTHTYKIVGIMSRMDHNISTDAQPATTALTKAKGIGEIDLVFSLKNPNKYKDFVKTLSDKYNAKIVYGHTDLNGLYGVLGSGPISAAIKTIVGILVVIVSIGSISLIYNSFAISISERTKQFGILKSVGATKKQIRSCILYEGAILGLIGIPIGIVIGLTGIGITFFLLQDNFSSMTTVAPEVKMTLAVNPQLLLVAALICYATILVAAWIPAKRAIRISPISAIRMSEDVKIKPGKVKTSKLRYKLFGFEGVLAAKNFKRNSKRYRFTIFSIALSVILFIVSAAYIGVVNRMMDVEYINNSPDIIGYIDNPNETIIKTITDIPEVDKVYYYDEEYEKVEFDKKALTVEGKRSIYPEGKHGHIEIVFYCDTVFDKICKKNGLDPEKYYDQSSLRGLFMKNGVNYDPRYDYKSYKAVRDGVSSVSITKGNRTGEVNVISGIDYYYSTAVEFLIVPYSMRANWLSEAKMKNGTMDALIYSKQYKEAENEIEKLVEDGKLPDVRLMNLTDNMVTMKMLTQILYVFMYGFITLMSLITIANVFNTISTNIMIRRREFAMLRSVGLSGKGFRKILNYECLVYGIRSLIVGFVLATGACALLYKLDRNSLDSFWAFLPGRAYLISGVVVFVIVFLSMIYSGKKIAGDDPVETLKNDNV